MVKSRIPLPLRNALAELSISALEEHADAAALGWLVTPTGAPPPAAASRLAELGLIESGSAELPRRYASHAGAAAEHAERALRAAANYRRMSPGTTDPLGQVVQRAAALWNEQLFFEVHEVLEESWKRAAGPARSALQGLAQIATAYHHLAQHNLRGARSLLAKGRGRLEAVPPSALPPLDVEELLAATAPWEQALAVGEAPPAADPPPLTLAR